MLINTPQRHVGIPTLNLPQNGSLLLIAHSDCTTVLCFEISICHCGDSSLSHLKEFNMMGRCMLCRLELLGSLLIL